LPITATAGDGWLRGATADDVLVFRLEASNEEDAVPRKTGLIKVPGTVGFIVLL
jgi:hypothetical protein